MNHPARLFAALSTAFALDPTSEHVECLSAEFVAAVALDLYFHREPLLLAVVVAECPEVMENLRLYLLGYGLALTAKPLKGRSNWLVGVRLARPGEEPGSKESSAAQEQRRALAS